MSKLLSTSVSSNDLSIPDATSTVLATDFNSPSGRTTSKEPEPAFVTVINRPMSSAFIMATTTTSTVGTSSPSSSSSFPVTISSLNALSPSFPATNLTIRSDAKDLSQQNKKQSTSITPLGIIKPIISITPVGSSPSSTSSSNSKSHSSSGHGSEGKNRTNSSSSNNFQGKGNKTSSRSSRSAVHECLPNPFMSFVSPLNFLANESQINEQSLRSLSLFPAPELLCNPFAPKSKCDVSGPNAILSLEKLSKMNEKRSRSLQSHDISKNFNRFLSAHHDALSNSYISKAKNNIPHDALSLVTNGNHEKNNGKDSTCSSKRRKWPPNNINNDEEKKGGNRHVDNRHHSQSGKSESLGNSNKGLGVSLSDSITLTPVSPTSPSNAPLNLSMKPSSASDSKDNTYQSLQYIPQMQPYKVSKRGPKPKNFATEDWQRISHRHEAFLSHMDPHLMQQHLKMNNSNANKAHQAASNEAHKANHHSLANSKESSSVTSRTAVSLLSGCSRFQDFASTSVNERVPSPRTSSQSPSRGANNGSDIFPRYLSKKDRGKEDGADALEVITTDDESSGSSEESETGSDSESSNESDGSSSGSDKSRETSSSRGQKRESDGDSPPRKRRKYIVSDERELRIPLEYGWRRLTKIRAYSYSGVRGEVIYYGPCGKKLKTYPEVVRYLEKNGIDDITRDNFTFSSKHNVGEFLEPLGNGEYVTIGENEVVSRIEEFRAHRSRRYVPVTDRSERSGSRRDARREEKLRQLEEAKLQQQLEEQVKEAVINNKSVKLRRSRRKEAPTAQQFKEAQAAEMRRQREHVKFLKMQEKLDRQEQLRVEREARAQHLLEERKRRQDMLERQRNEEAMRKNKEKESKRLQSVVLKEQELQKRREMLVIVDLERERRRQHMIDRIKEEKILEKQMQRERKMEQRQLELYILRELKKPVEDMELKDMEPLQKLDRIPGVKLAGKAFADILMVFEFLHTFGEALGFDMDSLPTLNTLQMAVLNDESCEEELLSLLHHLLICAIEDPGLPVGTKIATAVGQSLKEIDITSSTVSEVLRIYIHANEGEKSSYLEWISRKPFLALNPTQKAAILAYLCNELLCSKTIIRQIDNNIEGLNNMRRDRWVVEGKVRNLKMIQTKKIAKQMLKDANKSSSKDGDKPKDGSETVAVKRNSNEDKKDDETREDSGNESEGSHEANPVVVDNEAVVEDQLQGESVEELGKQIDKLVKQQNQFRKKLQKTSQQIRALSFGQDRYKRRYWLLSHAGGVFVEGLESSELLEDLTNSCAKGSSLAASDEERKLDMVAIKAEPKEVERNPLEVIEGDEVSYKIQKEESVMNEDQGQQINLVKNNDQKDTHEENCGKSVTGTLPVVPEMHINAEKILKTFEERTLKPWFSILPRMPCDETSLTRIHSSKALHSFPQANNSSTKHSSETWTPASSTPQASHLQNLRSTTFLPQFTSPLHLLYSTPLYLQNNHLLNSSAASSNNSSLLSWSNMTHFNLSGLSNESELLLSQLNNPPAEAQPIPSEFQSGWWRISDPNQLRSLHQKLHPRGIREKLLQMKLEKYMDVACEACNKPSQVADFEITDLDREISQNSCGTPEADKENDWSWEMALRVDLAILEQVENLEEKVVNASMQNKHWKLPPKATEDENVIFYPACGDAEQCKERENSHESQNADAVYRCPLSTARQRLLELEENIERRYIKPPLGYSNNEVSIIHPKHNSSMNSAVESTEEIDIDDQSCINEIREAPEGLLRWRAAVQNSRTSSQLAVCLNYLENLIAWDRSIMKACCQFCHCKNMCICDNCPKAYHTDCIEPPLSRTPKSRWLCPRCRHRTVKGKSKSKKGAKDAKDGSDSEELPAAKKSDKSSKSEARVKDKKIGVSKDLAPCRSLLADLETHEDAWPFLLPVNTKLFPSYRKVIRRPMDLSSIRNKLENGSYKTRNDFMNDVQLIFKNCETFNEDDSPVGKAGHSLRAFFDKKWSELMNDK
ncbi:Bromodomain adjacent to zinc finger domain protein 2B [Chamberlinius hualienensis]